VWKYLEVLTVFYFGNRLGASYLYFQLLSKTSELSAARSSA